MNDHAAEIHKPRLQRRVGQAGIDLFVELADNGLRSVSRRADAVPGARLITWNEFGKRRKIWQRRRTRRRGDGQSAQLALAYKSDRPGRLSKVTCTRFVIRSVYASASPR